MAQDDFNLGQEIGSIKERVNSIHEILTRQEGYGTLLQSHDKTIATLCQIASDNSGLIKLHQNLLQGENGKGGIVREIDELKKYNRSLLEKKIDNESLSTALTPIASEFKVRQEFKADTKKKLSEIAWDFIKEGSKVVFGAVVAWLVMQSKIK